MEDRTEIRTASAKDVKGSQLGWGIQGIIYYLDADTFRSSQNINILLWNILVDEYDMNHDRIILDFAVAMMQRYQDWEPEYELVRIITNKRV